MSLSLCVQVQVGIIIMHHVIDFLCFSSCRRLSIAANYISFVFLCLVLDVLLNIYKSNKHTEYLKASASYMNRICNTHMHAE